jgi:hypothetical protein
MQACGVSAEKLRISQLAAKQLKLARRQLGWRSALALASSS